MSGNERAWCLIITVVAYATMLVAMGQYERFCIAYSMWLWLTQDQ